MNFNIKCQDDMLGRQKLLSAASGAEKVTVRHRIVPTASIVKKECKTTKTNKKKARCSEPSDLDENRAQIYQLPNSFVHNTQMSKKANCKAPSASSSSCSSIEREADNFENLDELTLEE